MTPHDRDQDDEDTYQTDFPRDRDSTADHEVDLVTVLETSSLAQLLVAESLLAGAEIPYLARGEMIQDLFGLGRLTAFNPVTGPVVLQVDRADLEAAQSLLADVTVGDDDDDEDGDVQE